MTEGIFVRVYFVPKQYNGCGKHVTALWNKSRVLCVVVLTHSQFDPQARKMDGLELN